MCRNIKTLFNFDPPATDDEIRAAALQFVRKLSGSTKPSAKNVDVWNAAIDDVFAAAKTLIAGLETTAPPKNRALEIEKIKVRSQRRFGYGVNLPQQP